MIDLKTLMKAGDSLFATHVFPSEPDIQSIADQIPEDETQEELDADYDPTEDAGDDQGDDEDAGLMPTDEMARAASKALETRRLAPPGQRTMGGLGLSRARDIANGVPLSVEAVRSMAAYFDKAEAVRASWPEGAKEWQAWNGYGGDAGAKWARETLERIQ
jgi:hypothetical protein